MGLIQFVIDNPVKVAVGVILLVMFGLLSLFNVPIQLTPDVDVPVVTVTTFWSGASPQEIESEIVDRQEDKLKSISGLKKMTSTSSEGMAGIKLEFPVGVDKEAALREVSDKLRQVPEYPVDVDEPTVSATDNDMENIIAWMILRGHEGVEVPKFKTFIEDNVKPILERAEGISEVNVYGGYDREIQIEVDAAVLAARGLTLRDVERALRRQNENISAGTILQGKRDFTYRTVGQFTDVRQVEDTVVAYRAGGPVFVRDVATVIDGFKKQRAFVRSEGDYVIALPARRETGANVLSAMENLKRQVETVNREILEAKGMGLELTQVYDETTYITSAIDLVKSNILYGGLLAIVILLLFLRSASATGVVAVSIPISVIGTFLVITLLGRSLNVVMLAGMAFAVGMVVDNAIVVLENIYRHRTMGKPRFQAALDGTREVWGAVLASTLTTMAVFIPVISIQEEAGQLFKDIAIAIAAAVGLSLLVSVLVIPPLAARTLGGDDTAARGDKPWFLGTWVASLVTAINRSTAARAGVVAGMTMLAVTGSWALAPNADYLPAGNQNLIFGILVTPPGYGIETYKQMADVVEDGDPEDPLDGLRPFWEADHDAELAAKLRPVQLHVGSDGAEVRTVVPPPIENFFFVAYGGTAFMGCTSAEPTIVTPLVPAMTRAAGRIPGVFPVFFQRSLFQGGGAGASVDLEIRSENLDDVVGAAGALVGTIMGRGFGFPSPDPSNFDLGRPEIQLQPNRTKAADVGLDVADVGFIVRACIDGAFIGEFNDKGDKIDMVLKVAGLEGASPHDVGYVPIYSPSGHVIPIASVVDFAETAAPEQINHIEQMPSVTLSVQSKPGVPLQETMDELENG
ncbi:MAG: efflux RND transporter permease subunit, partial [Phycisphaerales bacterium]